MLILTIYRTNMKHYCAKPSAQLPKHIKSLQDDTEHAVMKPQECALHIINAQCICACARLAPHVYLPAGQLDKSRDVMKLARSMSQQKPIKHTEAKTVKESRSVLSSRHF